MAMDAGSVNVTYGANVDAFIANAKKADAALENSGKVAEQVSKRQMAAADFAAKFEADAVSASTRKIVAARQQVAQATSDYIRIQGMARAGMLEEAQATQATQAAFQRLTLAKQQLTAVTQEVLVAEKAEATAVKAAGEAAGAASVLHLSNATALRAEAEASEMAAAAGGHLGNSAKTVSGGFMLMEGRMPIRALERMIGQSETLAPLMETAFPVVGAIAAGEAIGDLAGQMSKLINQFFYYGDAVDAALQKDRALSAQFEKDALQAEAYRKQEVVLQGGQQALKASGYDPSSGKAPTPKQLQMEERGEHRAAANYVADQDDNSVALFQKQLDLATEKAHKLQMVVDGITYGDRTKASIDLGPANMEVTNAEQGLANAKAQQGVDAAEAKKATMREASEAQQQATEAAQKAAAAARKASEDKLRAMEQSRQAEEQEGKLGAQADLNYWQARIGAFTKGSSEYGAVQKKITEDRTSLARSSQEYAQIEARGAETTAKNAAALEEANAQLDLASHRITKLQADQRIATAQTTAYTAELKTLRDELAMINADQTIAPEDRKNKAAGIQNQISELQGQQRSHSVQNQITQAADAEEAAHALREQSDAVAALTAAQQKNADQTAQMMIAHAMSTGAISKEDEAQQLAALHASEYASQLAKLQQERASALNDPKLTDQQRQLAITKIDVQATTVQGDANRAAMTDQWNAQEQTAVGGFISALDQIAAAGKDHAAMMKSLTSSVVSDVNKSLIEALTTRRSGSRHLLAGLGHDAATKVAMIGLQSGEGMLAGGLASLLTNHAGVQGSAVGLSGGSTALCGQSETKQPVCGFLVPCVHGLPLPIAA